MPGCMPLFMLLSALLVGGLMMLVQVDTPKRLRPKGEGNIYYRDDAILRYQISQRCPTPLHLPSALDPVRQVHDAAAGLSWIKPVSLLPLASPNRAKEMASKMVVLPAPVSPVIKYRPLVPSWARSSS